MTYHDLRKNPEPAMALLQRRFPNLDQGDVRGASKEYGKLARRIAAAHDLTPREAALELDDALFAAALNKRAARR